MKNGTVRKRIVLGYSAVVLLMVALCAFAYVELVGIESRAALLREDSVAALYAIGRVQVAALESYAAAEQHVLDQDSGNFQQIRLSRDEKASELSELFRKYESHVKTANDKELYDAIRSALTPYAEIWGRVVRLEADSSSRKDAARLLRDRLTPAYAKLQSSIQAEVESNRAGGDESAQQIGDAVGRAKTGLLVSLLIGFVLALGAGYLLVQAINRPLSRLLAAMELMRVGNFSQNVTLAQDGEFGVLSDGLNLVGSALSSLVRRVQQSGLQVNTSATEIAATSQEQLSTASQVAATTAEIGATSKEISATAKELVRTIQEIADVAEKTAALAGSGQNGLIRMKATMQQVMEASEAINARLGTLSEKAGNIGTVVTTITKVADQTNLLSLNAAIEAEKAGDYGRGFAVVATEIRRLADQTAGATGDIEQMVKEMQSAVAAGVMGMDKFSDEVRRGVDSVHQVGEELSQIIQHVQALTPDLETVSEGMQSQSLGAQQISDALTQLSEASKQTVESMRQSNLAIEQLNEAARGLQDGVARFTLQA